MARSENELRRRNTQGQQQRTSSSRNESQENQSANQDENTTQQQQPQVQDAMRQFAIRMLLMYVLYQYYFKPKSQSQDKTVSESTGTSSSSLNELVDHASNPLSSILGTPPQKVPKYYFVELKSTWKPNVPIQFAVFTSLDEDMSFREAHAAGWDGAAWYGNELEFNHKDSNYMTKNLTLRVPQSVSQQNSTWYAHVFVVRDNLFDKREDEIDAETEKSNVLYYRHELVTWIKVDSSKKGKKLLGGSEDEEKEDGHSDTSDVAADAESDKDTVIRYDQVWKPTMTIVVVTDTSSVVLGQLPPGAASRYRVHTNTRQYYPALDVNEFWTTRDMLSSMNESVEHVQVESSFKPMSVRTWGLMKQFDMVWDSQIQMGVMQVEEKDNWKKVFTETNPWLLGTTFVVSIAHTVLEVLAFRNDVSHWKNIKSMEGVSVRSMVWKIVMEVIVFLYLWDNETSWMVTAGNGVGVLIAVWKLGKAVKFEKFGEGRLFGILPWWRMADRESYAEKTKEYDEQAMKYLGYVMYPLVGCYALYSLKYDEHKSWYSWVIGSLVGAVYAFGFLMMVPQIFINYKLKSVAHMPMKAMMYKTLNTVIDDLFSFIIKMPWLHRVACFRDDVVFIIVLYQRWIYPVDKTRVNEFGQQFESEGEESSSVSGGKGEHEKKNE